ncbi:MAG: TonB-dependent receptor [Sphingomonas sp.]|nr:TonB-dependent receptor [Sphingomonas sp.]
MRINNAIFPILGALSVAATAAHAEERRFTIPAGTLGSSAVILAQQANLNVGIFDSTIVNIRTREVVGTFSARRALERLLAGTGCSYAFVDQQTVRIFRQPIKRLAKKPVVSRQLKHKAPEPTADIIVTASKQGTPLARFPGTVRIVDVNDALGIPSAAQGTQAVIERLPVITSTSLGPGRDKLFIRGVADSSFSGPSQATVGQYLGDARLNYSAPDPDLSLYDIARVELLEGPQGTLYGTGSLGGVLRLVPNRPDLKSLSGSTMSEFVITQRGGSGGDGAAILNVPLVRDSVALRGVAYRSIAPGYINDIRRGLKNINQTRTTGGRIAALLQLGNSWSVSIGGLVQNIDSNDGQYAETGLPPRTRRSAIAQPFNNDYFLAYITLEKAGSWGSLASTTSYVDHRVATTFDATGFPNTAGPIRFDETVATTLLSHETRISGRGPHARWIVGVSAVHSVDLLQRRLGDPVAPPAILGVRNEATEVALFGQYSRVISSTLEITAGARLNYAQALGEPLDQAVPEPANPKRGRFVVLPMAALTWRPSPTIAVFLQAQQGYRASGLSVAGAATTTTVQRFVADRITTIEAGLKFGEAQRSRVWGDVTTSVARWVDIQSDLIDTRGLPYTTNIGDGRVIGVEGYVGWRVTPQFDLDASLFANLSRLDKPGPLYAAALDRELPNIAELGGRVGFRFHRALTERIGLTIDGSLRYVGKSTLGIGQLLNLDQGDYAEISVGSRVEIGRFGVSINVRNLGNVVGNRFAYGNPFSVAAGTQSTPLRPRTARIGIDTKF